MSFWIPDPKWEIPELWVPGKKPLASATIDWSNGLTQGLKQCFMAGTLEDLVDGTLGDHLSDTGGTWEVRVKDGNLVSYIEASASWQPGITHNQNGYNQEMESGAHTVLMHFDTDPDRGGASSNSLMSLTPWVFNGSGILLGLRGGPNYDAIYNFHRSGASSGGSISTNIPIATSVVALFTWDGISAGAGTMRGCIRGYEGREPPELLSFSTTATAPDSSAASDQFFGNNWGHCIYGSCHSIMRWDRFFTDAELLSMALDPYHFLTPR